MALLALQSAWLLLLAEWFGKFSIQLTQPLQDLLAPAEGTGCGAECAARKTPTPEDASPECKQMLNPAGQHNHSKGRGEGWCRLPFWGAHV